MRAKAYLERTSLWVLLLLCACTTASPCEVQGGRCTRTDVECGAKHTFVGYDPQCEPDSKCCVPVAGGAVVDAGHPCTRNNGKCQTQDLPCMTGTVAIGFDDVCGAGNQCCAKSTTCAAFKGKCASSCNPNEALGFNATDCRANEVCCSPR